jgi:polysaccharide export outer membrane protein
MPRVRFIARLGAIGSCAGRVAAGVAVSTLLLGCEVDSWMDPSRTGYFETTPTTMPILSRLDVIERSSFKGAQVAPPQPEDLVPGELKYRLAPGDELRIDIFELIQPGESDIDVRVVDQTGNVRIKEIGDVPAAGLTLEEFQREVEIRVGRILQSPVVSVALTRAQSFQFSISGAVQTVGVFGLTKPDLRLTEALALAGGTFATTQRITVVRAAPLDDTLNPVYPPATEDANAFIEDTGAGGGTTQPKVDLDALIEGLGGAESGATGGGAATDPPTAPAPGAVGRARPTLAQDDTPAVDIDDVSVPRVADAEPATPAPRGTQDAAPTVQWTFDTASGRWVRGAGAGNGNAAEQSRAAAAAAMYATRIIEVDYQALIKGDPNLDVVIRPNDRIYVEPPETGFIYIDGEINRIGVYELQNSNGRLTLSRFVSAAGGLSPTAIPNRVDLVRVVGKDREATIRVDLAAIRNRSEPDIYMRPDDHVIIGTNLIATPLAIIRNGFRMTYGFGFLLDRNFGNDVFGPPPEFTIFDR